MDDGTYFAGQALQVILLAHLTGKLAVQDRADDGSLDIERAAWRIAANMIAAAPEAV